MCSSSYIIVSITSQLFHEVVIIGRFLEFQGQISKIWTSDLAKELGKGVLMSSNCPVAKTLSHYIGQA
jgi:hypothetical protein